MPEKREDRLSGPVARCRISKGTGQEGGPRGHLQKEDHYVFDITCCPRKIHPELCRAARRATGGPPFPASRAGGCAPAETASDHPRGSGVATPARA
jgi:hypothetical protein